MNPDDLIVVASFRTPADAQIAKGILDEEGIQSMVRSDNAGGMYPGIAEAELLVRAMEVDKATEALQRRQRQSGP